MHPENFDGDHKMSQVFMQGRTACFCKIGVPNPKDIVPKFLAMSQQKLQPDWRTVLIIHYVGICLFLSEDKKTNILPQFRPELLFWYSRV